MGRSSFLQPLLLSMLLLLSFSFSQGFGRKVMETVEFQVSTAQLAEFAEPREMMETMEDYQLEPGPNVNPRTGYILSPPPQP